MKTKPLEDELFEEIGDNVNRLQSMIQFWVDGKKELKSNQRQELEEYEAEMLSFLWRCRGLLTVAKLARMVGLSRQTLYEKWQRYGYAVDDEIKG